MKTDWVVSGLYNESFCNFGDSLYLFTSFNTTLNISVLNIDVNPYLRLTNRCIFKLSIVLSISLDAAKKLIEKKENNRNKIINMLQLAAPKKMNKNQLKRLLELAPKKQ
jgi:hypothetical protein